MLQSIVKFFLKHFQNSNWNVNVFLEVIKVYDGDLSYKRKIFRTITVSRLASAEHILNTTLEAFHISRNPGM